MALRKKLALLHLALAAGGEVRKSSIGGQGVMEGVMMRSPEDSALAVRKPDGSIVTKKWKNKQRKSKILKLPIIRGVVNFIDMMVQGVGTITDAAKMLDESAVEEYEPSRFEKFVANKTGKNAMDVMMVFAVVIAVVLAVGLFFILPTTITSLIRGSIESVVLINLIDGLIRLAIFLGYMILVTQMKEIKRVFMYHGAEHKTIATYERDLPLTVENARPQRRLHPRCGTSYLLLVMVIAIIVYSFLGWSDNILLRFGLRLLMLPIIAGVAYEVLKATGRSDNIVMRAIRWPGMQLQRLTTREPDDSMLEIAIVAFEMALGEKSEAEIQALIAQYDRSEKPEEPAEAMEYGQQADGAEG